MADDIARLGYEIDSSQAKGAAVALLNMSRAAAMAEGGAAKLQKSFRNADGTFRKFDSAVQDSSVSIKSLASEFNPVLSQQLEFAAGQKRIADAIRLGVIDANAGQAAMERLQVAMLGAGNAATVMGKGMGAANANVSNLLFNFQDIGMMMMAGQNPLMLAVQQGTQVSGIFYQMQQSGQSMGGAIKSALLGLVSPMSLVTLGAIAGGAALVQLGMSAFGAGEETKTLQETIDDLASSVSAVNEIGKVYSAEGLQSLVDKYGEVNLEILAMIENQKNFAIADATKKATDAVAKLREEFSGTLENIDVKSRAGAAAMADMVRQTGLTKQGVHDLKSALDELGVATTFEERAAAFGRVNAILAKTGMTTAEVTGKAIEAEDAMRQLASSAPSANWMNAAISGVVALGDVIRGRIAEAARLHDEANMTTGNLDWAKNEFGFLSPDAWKVPDSAATGGGSSGGGGADPYAANLQRLIESLQTERETVDAWYQENLALIEDRRALEFLGEAEHKSALEALEQEHQERLSAIQSEAASRRISDTASLFGELANIAAAGGKRSAKAVATSQAVEGTINAYGAAIKALNTPGLTLAGRFAAYASVLGAGLKGVAAINSAGGGGSGGGIKASGPTSATSARSAEPERVARVHLMGEDWIVALVESLAGQLYEASSNGKVIISRAGA